MKPAHGREAAQAGGQPAGGAVAGSLRGSSWLPATSGGNRRATGWASGCACRRVASGRPASWWAVAAGAWGSGGRRPTSGGSAGCLQRAAGTGGCRTGRAGVEVGRRPAAGRRAGGRWRPAHGRAANERRPSACLPVVRTFVGALRLAHPTGQSISWARPHGTYCSLRPIQEPSEELHQHRKDLRSGHGLSTWVSAST